MRKLLSAAVVLSLLFAGNAVAQQQIQITVENLQPADGFYFTPVWLGVHDGNFDLFDPGNAASAALELLAEEGDASGVSGDFASSANGQHQFSLNASDRYLSYATMIIPTNDSFFANGNPLAVELLDASGTFTGDQVLEFSLADLWDAGTEENDTLGAPFSVNGGLASTDTVRGVVALGPDLSNVNGLETPAGTTINFDNASTSPVLRISISAAAVPEPSSASVLGLATLGCLLRRRRK